MNRNEISDRFESSNGPFAIKLKNSSSIFYGFYAGDLVLTLKNQWRMVSTINAIEYQKTKNKELTVVLDGDDIISIENLT